MKARFFKITVRFVKIMKCDILRTKNTYNEAIFYLWPEIKAMFQSGIPDMIPEKNIFLVIVPLRFMQHGQEQV